MHNYPIKSFIGTGTQTMPRLNHFGSESQTRVLSAPPNGWLNDLVIPWEHVIAEDLMELLKKEISRHVF
jgi:hypothetical protein